MKLNNKIQRSGILFVISSPSGAGKTTLARKLIEIDTDIELSISVTTRYPRKSEKNNRDYIFVDEKSFEKMIKEALPDASIDIQDLAGDGNHYSATVTSSQFKGKNKVQQHKMVYDALKGKMGNELHALALKTKEN